MRKTGCSFVADVLQRELPPGSLRVVGKHTGWDRIPPEAAGLPVLVYVRNPWDWYVSWYHFNLARDVPTLFWRKFSKDGSLDFPATVRNAVSASSKKWGSDFYSAVFRNILGRGFDAESLTVGRFESLVDDLDDFLAKVGVGLTDEAIDRIRVEPPVNVSDHRSYHEYFDDELRDVVASGCRMFIDRFDYRFETAKVQQV
jgi:hypothetical protein